MISSIVLLVLSNIFMTIAWYGHLKSLSAKPLWIAIGVSWGIAFFEYCLQVPGNRIGFRYYTLPQLKILQEVITLVVFVGFARIAMGVKLTPNMLWAGLCLVGAVFFIFRDAKLS
ncbi:DMT family protein [bacterium]|nr:DMT family protein [bacterium]